MARLPIPGSDSGQWGTLLNDFLGQAHDTSGALKTNSVGSSQIQGDAVTSAHVANGALPQAKVASLTGDLAAKVSTTDARLNLDYTGLYPQEGYGFFAATDLISNCSSTSDTSTSTLLGVRVWVPANKAISSISACIEVAGTLTTGGTNGFAVYTDAGVLVDSTTNNDNLWSSTGWRTATFVSPIAAQSSGRFVYVCFLIVGYSTPPKIYWCQLTNTFLAGASPGTSNKRSFYNGGGTTSFPASFNPITIGTTNNFLPLVGLA